MKKSSNLKLLNDNDIGSNEKLKLSIYIKKQSIIEADALKSLTDSQSRNDVIEKALDFYFAYTTSQISQDYLCGVFGSKMEGLVNTLGTRMSRSNFRAAVETDMLTRMLASVFHINKSEYDKLRQKSVQDVKRTNGAIDMMDAISESEDVN